MSAFGSISKYNHVCRRKLHIARTVEEMRAYHFTLLRKILTSSSKGDVIPPLLGFVPTMGALHDGHVSLISRSQQEMPYTAVSIFVNPSQFSPGEDLEKYPRPLERDLQILKDKNVDVVFLPSNSAVLYSPKKLCHVEPSAFNQLFEGKARPEFFRGVATIVCKLLNIVQPTRAYFGQVWYYMLLGYWNCFTLNDIFIAYPFNIPNRCMYFLRKIFPNVFW